MNAYMTCMNASREMDTPRSCGMACVSAVSRPWDAAVHVGRRTRRGPRPRGLGRRPLPDHPIAQTLARECHRSRGARELSDASWCHSRLWNVRKLCEMPVLQMGHVGGSWAAHSVHQIYVVAQAQHDSVSLGTNAFEQHARSRWLRGTHTYSHTHLVRAWQEDAIRRRCGASHAHHRRDGRRLEHAGFVGGLLAGIGCARLRSAAFDVSSGRNL